MSLNRCRCRCRNRNRNRNRCCHLRAEVVSCPDAHIPGRRIASTIRIKSPCVVLQPLLSVVMESALKGGQLLRYEVLEEAVAIVEMARSLVELIRRKDRDLASWLFNHSSTSQVRRAVSSITLNLGEAFGRQLTSAIRDCPRVAVRSSNGHLHRCCLGLLHSGLMPVNLGSHGCTRRQGVRAGKKRLMPRAATAAQAAAAGLPPAFFRQQVQAP
jgi:hypothetical protein